MFLTPSDKDIEKVVITEKTIENICASFQETAVKTLTSRLFKAIEDTGIKSNALEKKIQAEPIIETIDPNLPSLPNITKTSTSKSTNTTKTISATQKYETYKGGHIKVNRAEKVSIYNTLRLFFDIINVSK